MKKPPQTDQEMYKNKPWSSGDEYMALGYQYKCWGKDLENAVKKDRSKRKIPMPTMKVPRGMTL